MGKIFFLILLSFSLHAEPASKTDLDLSRISEAMGHLIGKNLQDLGLKIDLEAVVKGLQDAAAGKNPPLDEDECTQAIASLQEENLVLTAAKNLAAAEEFLEKNKVQAGVVSLEKGQIQFQTVKEGIKEEAVQPYNSPLIRYSGHYLNGEIFGKSEEGEIVSLEETIPGFRKGILGMKEGERRTVFIHPNQGYGDKSAAPNSLLIFDIEIVKTDAMASSNPDPLISDRVSDPLLETPSGQLAR
jgi:peptidylprolyl isomerase